MEEVNQNPFDDPTDRMYPALQYSMFYGKDQLVIRAGSVAELAATLAELVDAVGDRPSMISGILENVNALVVAGKVHLQLTQEPAKGDYRPRGSQPQPSDGPTCKDCGAAAEIKSGVSQKTGKPWTGTFCTANKQHVVWGR